jgi:hypothetical protein
MKALSKKSAAAFHEDAACRVQGGVARLFVTLGALALAGVACGRSPIDLAPPVAPTPVVVVEPPAVDAAVEPVVEPSVEPPVEPPVEPKPEPPVEPPVEPRLDAAVEVSPPRPDAAPPPVEAGPVCHPQPETCNGVDDDCDGRVDEDLPAIPCPGGASRYCVGGHYSECPRRCEACVPGSQRECFTTLCTFWGTETCASDGRSFGACREGQPPQACKDASNSGKRTRALEDCCLAQGLCCVDEFDIDGDGNRTEMMGRCDTVTCGP